MSTSTFKTDISAPIQQVWNALSTTEGMNGWLEGIKVDTDWQVNSPISFTMYDNGEVMVYNGEKMIFEGIITAKNENKEISYAYPKKLVGIESEQYLLDELNAGITRVTFKQSCTSEQTATEQEEDQRQILDMLKNKLEKN